MRRAIALLLTGFLFLASVSVSAQEKEKESSQPPSNTGQDARASRSFYRLDFTIRELQEKKIIAVRYYSMLLTDDGNMGNLKSGARLPIATGSFSGGPGTGLVNTQFQYLDVGVNLHCRIRTGQPYALLLATVEFSSPALPDQGPEPGSPSLAKGQPVLRQASSDVNAPLQPGKALLLASMDDPSSPRRFEIEVTPTKLQ